jgi:hypothetical protein
LLRPRAVAAAAAEAVVLISAGVGLADKACYFMEVEVASVEPSRVPIRAVEE